MKDTIHPGMQGDLQARGVRRALKWAATSLGLAAGAYAGYAGVTWMRYGHPASASAGDRDPLLDRFMPIYEIVERHHVRVSAPLELNPAVVQHQE